MPDKAAIMALAYIQLYEATNAYDGLMMANPSIARRSDDIYLLVYKCVAKRASMPFGGPVVHMAATSTSPTGPFVKHSAPIFTAKGKQFPAEDPFIWQQDGRLWAIVKDVHGAFTPAGRSLVLFQSSDGMDWELAANPLVSRLEICWENGSVQKLSALERPQLWLENRRPAVLFCAGKQGDRTFNVHIPLRGMIKRPEKPNQAREDSARKLADSRR